MISIAADYLILEKMTHFQFEKTTYCFNLIKMINVFFSGRNEVHLAGHCVYRPTKENAFLLFFLIFLIPEVKKLIALVIKQAINTENLGR